ncbi:hypothetical protein PR048_022258 [Dryococelus australis]|uniref:Uncharacterized protein n=1 Tax=Dryococelus australis TaxID=614101 RepID=A0ABQ9H0H4_9NEOP|nr:hypothetical protein PR048_022258 [Dryococelus australis]
MENTMEESTGEQVLQTHYGTKKVIAASSIETMPFAPTFHDVKNVKPLINVNGVPADLNCDIVTNESRSMPTNVTTLMVQAGKSKVSILGRSPSKLTSILQRQRAKCKFRKRGLQKYKCKRHETTCRLKDKGRRDHLEGRKETKKRIKEKAYGKETAGWPNEVAIKEKEKRYKEKRSPGEVKGKVRGVENEKLDSTKLPPGREKTAMSSHVRILVKLSVLIYKIATEVQRAVEDRSYTSILRCSLFFRAERIATLDSVKYWMIFPDRSTAAHYCLLGRRESGKDLKLSLAYHSHHQQQRINSSCRMTASLGTELVSCQHRAIRGGSLGEFKKMAARELPKINGLLAIETRRRERRAGLTISCTAG